MSVPTSGSQLMSGLFDLKHDVGHHFVCECTYFTQIIRSSVPIGTILQCILLEKLMLYIQGTLYYVRTYSSCRCFPLNSEFPSHFSTSFPNAYPCVDRRICNAHCVCERESVCVFGNEYKVLRF